MTLSEAAHVCLPYDATNSLATVVHGGWASATCPRTALLYPYGATQRLRSSGSQGRKVAVELDALVQNLAQGRLAHNFLIFSRLSMRHTSQLHAVRSDFWQRTSWATSHRSRCFFWLSPLLAAPPAIYQLIVRLPPRDYEVEAPRPARTTPDHKQGSPPSPAFGE